MEVRFSHSLQLSRSMTSPKIGLISPTDSVCFGSNGLTKRMHYHRLIVASRHVQSLNVRTRCQRTVLRVLSSSQDEVPVIEVGPASTDEDLTLKTKSEEVEPLLNGACIYIVGMMGSGKTTVGKILSASLGYSFCDCDMQIEKAAGGTSVADIFKLHGENFFRDNETEVLSKLSSMHRLVISTGGGAVVRPINWKHMRKGVSVWLDVPIEALARRISQVGTESRPLLHDGSGDAYDRALNRLSTLWEERGEAYTNASAHVSLQSMSFYTRTMKIYLDIAANCGYKDVCQVSPTLIAIEALVQIEKFLKK